MPSLGDLITGAIGLYVISEARRIGVSRWTLARMYTNWGIDVSVGALPIVGDLFDLAFKSNTKNVRMLIAELKTRARKYGRAGSTPLDLDIIEHEPVRASSKSSRVGAAPRKQVNR